jgi:hypothetical protein
LGRSDSLVPLLNWVHTNPTADHPANLK